MARWHACIIGAGLLCLAGFLGCSGETIKAPPTQRVQGMVLRKDGKPFPGGTIEFRSSNDPGIGTMGIIADDGSFTLQTISGNRQASEGIPEGEFTVTVTPKVNEKGETESQELSKPYTIKAGDTKITVTLEK